MKTSENLLESLLQDNVSEEAKHRRELYNEHRSKNTITYEVKCGDAREVTILPTQSYVDSKISAAINPLVAMSAFNSRSVAFAIFVPHYDGDTEIPGQAPGGCGGLDAKAELVRSGDLGSNGEDPLERFLKNRIRHQDLFINSIVLARELANYAEREQPILVAPQDHRTGKLKPVALYQKRRKTLLSIEPAGTPLPLEGQYEPEKLYEYGIPQIERAELPDMIQKYLKDYDKQLDAIHNANKNFTESQRIQNPRMILFSTDLRDGKVWLPNTFYGPNVGFRLTVPREEENGSIRITPDNTRVAIAQSLYVMRENIRNQALSEAPFHATNDICIFTKSYELSREFAQSLARVAQDDANRNGTESWLELPGRKIIIGETHKGVITEISRIDFAVNKGIITKFEDKPKKIKRSSAN